MMEQLPTLQALLKQLQQVPYLASKNIYRVLNHFLAMPEIKAEQFCKIIMQAKKEVMLCPTCCTWKEKERPCSFCDSTKRDRTIICVVETWQELVALEKTGAFTGLYHVLGGALSPLEGVGPENLRMKELLNRLDGIKEIILATNQTAEGEATAAFVAHHLKNHNVKISCLARGMPVGSSLEFMDRVTVYKALSERRSF